MRAIWAPLVVLALLVPGCVRPETPPTPPPIPTPPPSPPTPPVGCGDCPDMEPDHTHDMWGGEERKVILELEGSLVPLPLLPCKRPGCAADQPAGDGDNYALGTAIADFDIPPPPEGGLVYEGAAFVEVTLHWARLTASGTDHPRVNVALDYLTAADGAGEFRPGGKLRPGEALLLPVGPLEADMPHQAKSLWVFRIHTEEANAFDFNLTVAALRGGPVAVWPEHPDVYAESPERSVFDGEAKVASRGSAHYWVDGSDAGWVFPDRVISWGTTELEVTVSDVRFTGVLPPARFVLEYHNASFVPKLGNGDQAGARLDPTTSDAGVFTFVLPVDEFGYDTPYGSKSRWGFRFVPRYDGAGATCVEGAEAVLAGCQWTPSELAARMRIVARGVPLG